MNTLGFQIKIRGEAEAFAIAAKAKAEAEQMAKKAEAWREYREAAMVDMLLETLPKVIHTFSYYHSIKCTRHQASIEAIVYNRWYHTKVEKI